MGEAEKKARLEKLASRLRKGAQVLEDLALEVEALLAEGKTPGQEANDFVKWYGEQWKGWHGGPYVDGGVKDRAQIKRLLKTLDVDELRVRAKRYLNTSDTYVQGAKHPLGLFASGINRWASDNGEPGILELEPTRPVDCKHQPACKTDAEHTRRKMSEMKGGRK